MEKGSVFEHKQNKKKKKKKRKEKEKEKNKFQTYFSSKG
jgi:hypothetical protein